MPIDKPDADTFDIVDLLSPHMMAGNPTAAIAVPEYKFQNKFSETPDKLQAPTEKSAKAARRGCEAFLAMLYAAHPALQTDFHLLHMRGHYEPGEPFAALAFFVVREPGSPAREWQPDLKALAFTVGMKAGEDEVQFCFGPIRGQHTGVATCDVASISEAVTEGVRLSRAMLRKTPDNPLQDLLRIVKDVMRGHGADADDAEDAFQDAVRGRSPAHVHSAPSAKQ
jgi:hypothetical protein